MITPARDDRSSKTSAMQTAILSSATFSSIATDDQGVIRIFNTAAERLAPTSRSEPQLVTNNGR